MCSWFPLLTFYLHGCSITATGRLLPGDVDSLSCVCHLELSSFFFFFFTVKVAFVCLMIDIQLRILLSHLESPSFYYFSVSVWIEYFVFVSSWISLSYRGNIWRQHFAFDHHFLQLSDNFFFFFFSRTTKLLVIMATCRLIDNDGHIRSLNSLL